MNDKKDDEPGSKEKSGAMRRAKGGGLGEILLRENVISIEQLDKARTEIAARGGTLSQRLTELGIAEEAIVDRLSKVFDIPSTTLENVSIPPEVLKLLPRRLILQHRIIPLSWDGDTLTYATADPGNPYLMDDFKSLPNFKKSQPVVTSERAIEKAINEFFPEDTLEDLLKSMDPEDVRILQSGESLDEALLERQSEDPNIVQLVNLIIVDAVRKGASDIHIETSEKELIVRYRIDGILHNVLRPSPKLHDQVVARIKILSGLKLDERRVPQDGRIKMALGSKEVDLRVAVCPCISGENVVARILDKSALQIDMTRLGFESEQLAHFQEAVNQPWGMVLVTGPTGSGKTTTLYSALMELNKPTRKILTVEDPVEMSIRGLSQVQVNETAQLTFAAALRSFLRQDPDVIMVGEIRDFETAEIAVKSALTGHLVLSTLHTNDAPSTINRLINMAVEPFLITSSLNLIIAQRLVRVICKHCKEPLAVPKSALIDLGIEPKIAETAQVYHGRGCDRCSNTGYKGRIALFEVLPITDEIKEAIHQHFSITELQREAVRLGMRTLRQSGLKKILDGATTIEEVLRATK